MKLKIISLLMAMIAVLGVSFSAGCNKTSSECRCENEKDAGTTEKLSPISFFSFDKTDKNGNYYDEISGKAALTQGNVVKTNGMRGGALYFDGSSKLSLSTLMPTGNAEHTIAAWIKLDKDKLHSNGENVIAGWGEYTSLSDTRLMIYHKQFCVTSFNVYTMYPISNAFDDKWMHFALTYDGSRYVMYINGIKTRTVAATNGINVKKSPLFIGGFSSNSLGFVGSIDQLYVFDKSLNETEISTYMNDKGNFKTKQADNLLPQTDEKTFNASNYAEVGWNEFVYDYDETKLKFAIKLPDNYDKNKKYPLIVFYHGDGSNGASAESIYTGTEFSAPLRAMQEGKECIVIVPVTAKPWLGVPNDVNTVYPYRIYDMEKDAVPNEDLVASVSLTDYCSNNLSVDKDRIYLCGYSRGMMASWYLLSQYANKYAAAVLCSGMGDPKISESYKTVPIWVFMGTSDPLVSFSDIKQIYDAYEAAGGNGRFTACTGAGHDVSEWLYKEDDLIEWLFEQKK